MRLHLLGGGTIVAWGVRAGRGGWGVDVVWWNVKFAVPNDVDSSGRGCDCD